MNQTIVYTYDNGGNIKSKKIYAYTTATDPGTPTQTISYTYDSTWKDKLTNYNGTAITYDAIGNPLTYRNGMSFTWNGRQMATANLNGTAVTYKYDADGLRNYKKVGNTVHEYEYVGGQLVYEKRGDLKFYYRYNAMGELASIKRVNAAGSEYTVYVVTNTRGDVEELRLADGSLYARYVYDSWGNVLHIYNSSGSEETNVNALSLQNPFRYRSYYYDAESGLYYLQSRYYDPVTCRFVNADDQLSTQSNNTGWNLFCYGGNNPVNNIDPTGHNFIKNGIKFIADKIIKPIVKGLQKVVSKKDATYSVGFAASGTIGLWSLSGQAGISVDTKGNVAIQASGSGGVTTSSAGFSATLYRTKTNAPNVNKLNGPGCQVGGSISVPVGNHTATIGGELNIIPDDSLNKVYLGDTFNVGLGFGSSLGEFHVEWGGTIPVGKTFNMFDVAKSVYIRIMEW